MSQSVSHKTAIHVPCKDVVEDWDVILSIVSSKVAAVMTARYE